MKTLELFAFDLDGTLLDTAPDFLYAVNILRERYQLDEADYKRYYKKMSKVDINIGNTYLKKTRDINDIIDQHTNMEKEYKENTINNHNSESSDSESSYFLKNRF